MLPLLSNNMLSLLPKEAWLALAGFIFLLPFWFYMRPHGLRSHTLQAVLTKTKKSREFLAFFCNMLVVEIGTVIALVALGDTPMTNTTVQYLIDIIWITIGIAAGLVLVILYESACSINDDRISKKNEKRNNEIREIAHHIWEEEGCPQGRDKEHWLKATKIWGKQHSRINRILACLRKNKQWNV